jgi:hypothetical protein
MARTERETSGKLVYVVRLRAEHDDGATIRGLRFVLKRVLRSFGLRCIGINVELADNNEACVIPMQAANR